VTGRIDGPFGRAAFSGKTTSVPGCTPSYGRRPHATVSVVRPPEQEGVVDPPNAKISWLLQLALRPAANRISGVVEGS
jgi:hypothetical protein